ncbi:ATP-binding protein [Desulfobaculum bizertense]|uniref:two-component system sensor histidine kinase NtrB n=1 Tax=Desulfobaculum bizertense TaxID=376490 RepID=UPI001F2C9B87|nr:ATP-binding protein [Desulfobaculum bizertense]UIJ37140.1 ATP-binding protein [Desulfobaculum bizertense]
MKNKKKTEHSEFSRQGLGFDLLDEVDSDVLMLDIKGRLLDLNRHAQKTLGVQRDSVLGQDFRQLGLETLCSVEDGTCPFEETKKSQERTEGVHLQESSDGKVKYIRVRAYPLQDAVVSGGAVLISRKDITGQVLVEQQLQQSQKMAAIGELSTYIAHEIRNPLFAIGGFANALSRSQNLSAQEREKVQIILAEARRLENILKSLLNFAQPTEGRLESVDLNSVVEQSIALMGPSCEQFGICVSSVLQDHLDPVQGVSELLKQCIINMMKNSLEAMEELGHGELVLRTESVGGYVMLHVEDTGPGIPHDKLEDVFNPFFSTKNKGSGLGLAMTKKIVDNLGGALKLESELGSGTHISVQLRPAVSS